MVASWQTVSLARGRAVGKASRLRRQKQEKDRQRRGGAGGSAPGAAFGPGTGFGPEPRRAQGPADSERVATAVVMAVTAIGGGDKDAYSRLLTELASERTPARTRAVSRGLVEMLRMSVSRVWRAGWQPTELTRHAGRELAQQHVSVAADMIAEEMRGYPAATVDRRWAAQVAAVRASSAASDGPAAGSPAQDNGTWWGSDADYLPAWAKRSGAVGGLRDAIATAIELLHLLQHLPVLERLLPLPGTARAAVAEDAPAAGSGGQADERMLSRIRALLAKAEATEYPEEAEALSARAQELMAKYSIDQALLAADADRADQPAGGSPSTTRTRGRRRRSCRPWRSPTGAGSSGRRTWAWRRWSDSGADLDAVEVLFTSLLVQANGAMLRAGARLDAYGRSRTRAFRQSFLVSYAVRIGERLAEATEHATQQAAAEQEVAAGTAAARGSAQGAGTALVPFLAARRQAVEDAVDEMFGNTLKRGRSVRATDAEGWVSGRAAADLATLHNRAPVAGR